MRKTLSLLAAALICAGAGFQATSIAQTIKGTDCVCNGESFFQASNICSELSRLAKADGILASNDNFKQIAVSGANISQILGFYKNCTPKPTYLISDGAGIDLMSSSNISALSNTLKQYLDEMKKGETKKLLWMIYPDPQGSNWATLKKNQDLWAVEVPKVMATITEPKVLLVDLRTVWAGHYSQYTSDGIHCTSAGGTATAEAFWKAMKADNFFSLTPVEPITIAKTATPSPFLGQVVANNCLFLSLSLDQAATDISMRIMTVSGRTLVTAAKQELGSGLRTVRFPLGSVGAGTYCLDIQAGQAAKQSALLVR
jgi:hypothetical protein